MYIIRQLNLYLLFLVISPFLSVQSVPADTGEPGFEVREIAGGLTHPWGHVHLPDGDILVTERAGTLRIIRDGSLDPDPVTGLPDNIYAAGQGGMLDIILHPDFTENRLVYFSYAGRSGNGEANTEVARARLSGDGNTLSGLEVIFVAEPKTRGAAHYGSRLLFGPEGHLFITLGDRYRFMDQAQSKSNHLGTVVRLNADGSIPPDNPFVGVAGAKPEIWSYGHRNVQGIALHPETGEIWIHEHGPKGGDEINILEKGANYGWPEITYGIDYDGTIISEKTRMEGMKQPLTHWTPSIAPCGMAFYTGRSFCRRPG